MIVEKVKKLLAEGYPKGSVKEFMSPSTFFDKTVAGGSGYRIINRMEAEKQFFKERKDLFLGR